MRSRHCGRRPAVRRMLSSLSIRRLFYGDGTGRDRCRLCDPARFHLRRNERARVFKACCDTALSTGSSCFVIAVASLLGWILAVGRLSPQDNRCLARFNGKTNAVLVILLIIAILLVLGCFPSMASPSWVILVPIFLPISNAIGMDPVQFAMVIILCIVAGGITPPSASFSYICSQVGGVPFRQSRGNDQVVRTGSPWPSRWACAFIPGAHHRTAKRNALELRMSNIRFCPRRSRALVYRRRLAVLVEPSPTHFRKPARTSSVPTAQQVRSCILACTSEAEVEGLFREAGPDRRSRLCRRRHLAENRFRGRPSPASSQVLRVNCHGYFPVLQGSKSAMETVSVRKDAWGALSLIVSWLDTMGASRAMSPTPPPRARFHTMAKTLARTCAPLGVTVNAVAPCVVRTEMSEHAHGRLGARGAGGLDEPMGRLQEVREIADACLFPLAIRGGSGVTGTILDVNAGC